MNKIYLIIALLFSCSFLNSQESTISIFSEEGDSFYLFLNGIRQNENPEVNVRVDNLTQPYYSGKIVFTDESISPLIEKNMMAVDVDGNNGHVTYKIKLNRKGNFVVRYFSFVPSSQPIPVSDDIEVVEYNSTPMPEIDFSATSDIKTTTTTTTTKVSSETEEIQNGEKVEIDINMGGIDFGVNVDIQEGSDEDVKMTTSTTTTTTYTTTTSGSGRLDQIEESIDVYEEVDCFTMNDADFNSAKTSISEKSFSDSKMTLSKQIAKNNCLTSSQIKDIMSIFDFENDRLEFAKFAYSYSYDRENYWKVNDAFDFESTIEELNQYIESKN